MRHQGYEEDMRDEPPMLEDELDELERRMDQDSTDVAVPPAHLQAELDDALASFWHGIAAGTIKEGATL